MTSNEQSGIIKFLDKEFDLKLLKQAIDKSSDSYIEPGKEISELRIDLPAEFSQDFKKPVLTLHEGKYVIIHMDDGFLEQNSHLVEKDGVSKRIVTKGFKAKFVTKYNFNQAKVVPPAPPVVHETPAPRPSYPKREFTSTRPQGQRNHSGGNWNGQTRSYGNRGN
jgi:hypothetical protein